jgi:hypothetical protein
MSSNIADALRRGPQAAAHITGASPGVLYPHVQAGDLALRKSQAGLVLNRRKTMATYNSSTLPADGLQNASFADIRLSGADIIAGITLRLSYVNNTGAQLQRWNARWAFYLLDHVDILAENGSTVLERIEPEHLSKSWLQLPPSAHERVKQGLQGGPDDNAGNPAALNDGVSRTLYFPLLSCSLASQEIPPFALASPIIVRCYFRGSAAFVGPFSSLMIPDGTAGLTITAFDAVVTAYQHDASERSDLARRYAMAGLRSPPLDVRFARPGMQRTQETISGNGLHSIRLSSVQGLVTSLSVVLQKIYAEGGFGYGLYGTPIKLDLVDAQGSSLYGAPLDYALLQNTQAITDGNVVDINLEKITALPIGGSSGEEAGQIHGYVVMNGDHSLQLTAAPGVYTVSVIYATVAHMRVSKSHITVHAS